jgi:hypothetical protein
MDTYLGYYNILYGFKFIFNNIYTHDFVHAGTTAAMLRTALISVTCIQAVISVFTFIAGIVCYHYISQRRRASAVTNKQSDSQNNPRDLEPELELNENAAYITIRPRM